MFDYFEKITGLIYKEWKNSHLYTGNDHPDEERLACFLEDKLSMADKDIIQKHLLSCDLCAEYLSTQLKIKPHLSLDVPALLLEKVKKIINQETKENLLEILLRFKGKVIEVIQTTGDVLLGQELIPAPILRSRQISEFKEEVNILKDLGQIRVLAKIETKDTVSFNLTIIVKDKKSQIQKNLRVTLLKKEIEMESYLTDSGTTVFENILPGNYTVEVIREEQKIAIINLEVKA